MDLPCGKAAIIILNSILRGGGGEKEVIFFISCLLYLNKTTRWQLTLGQNNPSSSCCRITHILLRTQDRWGLHTDGAGVTSVCVLLGGRVRVKSDLPVCQSLPCCRGVGGSVRGSVPAAGRSGRSRVWAAIRRSPTSCPCCYFSRGVGWKAGGETDTQDMSSQRRHRRT